MTRIRTHWQNQDPEDEEEVVLLLAAAIVFTIALAAVLAFYSEA
jgi:hypothetical protein